jgi:hypothetical protein
MAGEFDNGPSIGRMDVGSGSWSLAVGFVSSVRPGGFAMAIDPSGSWKRPQLTRSAGGILSACDQKFGLDLKEAGFDRAGTPKSPQQAC